MKLIAWICGIIIGAICGLLSIGFKKTTCGMCGKKVRLKDTEEVFVREEYDVPSRLTRVCEDCLWLIEEGNGR